MDEEEMITPSCGNVFEDLGLEDSEEMLVKANYMLMIKRGMKEKKLTYLTISKYSSIPQIIIRSICNGEVSNVSLEMMKEILQTINDCE